MRERTKRIQALPPVPQKAAKRICITIEPETYARAQQKAKAERRSVSNFLAVTLENTLAA
jgi:hypothetical protein